MRNLIFVVISVLFLSTSCTSDEILEKEDMGLCSKTKGTIINDLLSFDSEEEYNALVDSLSVLSDSALLVWEQEHCFSSLYRLHSLVSDAILEVKSEEEYDSIKMANKTYLLFNTIDSTDYSAYLPVENVVEAVTLNRSGEVCINNKVVNKRKFETFDDYANATCLPVAFSSVSINEGINHVSVLANHRKFNATFYAKGNDQYFSVSARKRVLGAWSSYTTRYFSESMNGNIIDYGEYKSGREIHIGHVMVHGTQIYMWTRGVGESHKAKMTIDLNILQ